MVTNSIRSRCRGLWLSIIADGNGPGDVEQGLEMEMQAMETAPGVPLRRLPRLGGPLRRHTSVDPPYNQPPATCQISRLPVEVLLMILPYLNYADSTRLRHSCASYYRTITEDIVESGYPSHEAFIRARRLVCYSCLSTCQEYQSTVVHIQKRELDGHALTSACVKCLRKNDCIDVRKIYQPGHNLRRLPARVCRWCGTPVLERGHHTMTTHKGECKTQFRTVMYFFWVKVIALFGLTVWSSCNVMEAFDCRALGIVLGFVSRNPSPHCAAPPTGTDNSWCSSSFSSPTSPTNRLCSCAIRQDLPGAQGSSGPSGLVSS